MGTELKSPFTNTINCTVLQKHILHYSVIAYNWFDLFCNPSEMTLHKNIPAFLYTKWLHVMRDLTADYILKWCCCKWNSLVKCSDICAQHSSRVNEMPQSGSSKYKIINRIFELKISYSKLVKWIKLLHIKTYYSEYV